MRSFARPFRPVGRDSQAVPPAPDGFLTRHPCQGAVEEPEVRVRELVDSMESSDQSQLKDLNLVPLA